MTDLDLIIDRGYFTFMGLVLISGGIYITSLVVECWRKKEWGWAWLFSLTAAISFFLGILIPIRIWNP